MINSKIEIYQLDSGKTEIKVQLDNETVWLNLNQMAELFGRDKSVVSRHLSNVFKEKELVKDSVVAKNATTASDGKVYQVDFYNLDVIKVQYRQFIRLLMESIYIQVLKKKQQTCCTLLQKIIPFQTETSELPHFSFYIS